MYMVEEFGVLNVESLDLQLEDGLLWIKQDSDNIIG